MFCRFCGHTASGPRSATCGPCTELINAGMWGLLACSWLQYRPENWVLDVAAFLEYTEGLGADLERLRSLVRP